MADQITIEFYESAGKYCAWIANSDGSCSGYKIVGSTKEDRAEKIKEYILNSSF